MQGAKSMEGAPVRGGSPHAPSLNGVGTRLTYKVGDNVVIREVRLGSSYLCSQDPRVLLGVSDHESIERIEVHWPSGITQVFEDIAVNQQLDIIEKGTPNLN